MSKTRTDLIQVFVFRRPTQGNAPGGKPGSCELLQLRRAKDPMRGSWQPVMGHADPGETAIDAAIRELREETGLGPDQASGWLGLWQLDGVHPFFIARADTIYLCPVFAAEAPGGWEPTLDDEHDAHRWVGSDALERFLWAGQRASVRELIDEIVLNAPAAEFLRIG